MRYCLLATLLALAACSKPAEEKKTTEVGVDVSKNPLGALGALGQAAKDAQKAQEEMAKMTPVEPLHFSKLIEALPDAPGGWTATAPKGESTSMGEMKISQASRRYDKDGGGQVKVSIADWAYHQALYMPFMVQANFSQETTEGYSKGIKMGTDPGREEYKTADKSGKRTVLVGKRFAVTVELESLDKGAFDEWWGRLKLGSLK